MSVPHSRILKSKNHFSAKCASFGSFSKIPSSFSNSGTSFGQTKAKETIEEEFSKKTARSEEVNDNLIIELNKLLIQSVKEKDVDDEEFYLTSYKVFNSFCNVITLLSPSYIKKSSFKNKFYELFLNEISEEYLENMTPLQIKVVNIIFNPLVILDKNNSFLIEKRIKGEFIINDVNLEEYYKCNPEEKYNEEFFKNTLEKLNSNSQSDESYTEENKLMKFIYNHPYAVPGKVVIDTINATTQRKIPNINNYLELYKIKNSRYSFISSYVSELSLDGLIFIISESIKYIRNNFSLLKTDFSHKQLIILINASELEIPRIPKDCLNKVINDGYLKNIDCIDKVIYGEEFLSQEYKVTLCNQYVSESYDNYEICLKYLKPENLNFDMVTKHYNLIPKETLTAFVNINYEEYFNKIKSEVYSRSGSYRNENDIEYKWFDLMDPEKFKEYRTVDYKLLDPYRGTYHLEYYYVFPEEFIKKYLDNFSPDDRVNFIIICGVNDFSTINKYRDDLIKRKPPNSCPYRNTPYEVSNNCNLETAINCRLYSIHQNYYDYCMSNYKYNYDEVKEYITDLSIHNYINEIPYVDWINNPNINKNNTSLIDRFIENITEEDYEKYFKEFKDNKTLKRKFFLHFDTLSHEILMDLTDEEFESYISKYDINKSYPSIIDSNIRIAIAKRIHKANVDACHEFYDKININTGEIQREEYDLISNKLLNQLFYEKAQDYNFDAVKYIDRVQEDAVKDYIIKYTRCNNSNQDYYDKLKSLFSKILSKKE